MNENNDVVILELDKPRELRLGHHAMKRFCALTGCRLTAIQDAIDDYDNLIRLLWVMLSEDDPDLTPEDLDRMIAAAERRKPNPMRLRDLIGSVNAAIIAAFGDEEDETEAEETPPKAAGTGAEA